MTTTYYPIVSFCAGGMRSLISAILLQRVAAERSGVVTRTSVFAGTSSGTSVISMLLASYSTNQIVEYFQTTQKGFFANMNRSGPGEPAYSVQQYYNLQSGIQSANPPLNSFSQKVVFTSFDLGGPRQGGWEPVLFTNLPAFNNGAVAINDAVVSSSATPGMFGAWNNCIDGTFLHHDPTLAAIAVALANGVTLDQIVVLDLGTGYMPNWIASNTAGWGATQWQQGDGNPSNQLPVQLVNGTTLPIFNAALNGSSANLVPMLLSMVLGARYVNLNPQLDRYIPDNATDDTSIRTMQSAAGGVDIGPALVLVNTYWPS